MNITGAILVSICSVSITHYYWSHLPQLGKFEFPLPFRAWLLRGVVIPLSVIGVFACGFFEFFPPLVKQVQLLNGLKSYWVAYLWLLTASATLITTYWCAVSLLCIAGMVWNRIGRKSDFVTLALVWSLILGPICYFIIKKNGWPSLGAGVAVWLLPIIASTAKLAEPPPVFVSYSKAEADLKFGRYDEAEKEIISQLEQDAQDFQGWMKLAELYAKQFGDLAAAHQTIYDLCDQPHISVAEISLALDTLASWHLEIGKDPASARAALTHLCERVPGTHSARMAQLRLQQLPRDREELMQQQERRAIRLPALRDDLFEGKATPRSCDVRTATEKANRCVELLKNDPNNIPAREQFAIILAEDLSKPEAGVEQLKLLLDMPETTENKRAEWLSMVAAWQLKLMQDPAAASQTCRRIIREFPRSPYAFAAQRRLSLMEMEDQSLRPEPG